MLFVHFMNNIFHNSLIFCVAPASVHIYIILNKMDRHKKQLANSVKPGLRPAGILKSWICAIMSAFARYTIIFNTPYVNQMEFSCYSLKCVIFTFKWLSIIYYTPLIYLLPVLVSVILSWCRDLLTVNLTCPTSAKISKSVIWVRLFLYSRHRQ